ncbi:hypothetical protein FNW02_29110 [Komarekiella sp. 'clone 1']|uniref:Uncharacterized protein n=1 Tax=Komarekiella delphini-convector SJRDD-AB1 TaxID=2593771 RepID=A0AA40T2K6_9NOST|nr:hypothetical protein [Komarekiella delphini-convector]MBD6619763.1 hypothetical protein [Komarekiella delphini-convector SJRDD-AB1]
MKQVSLHRTISLNSIIALAKDFGEAIAFHYPNSSRGASSLLEQENLSYQVWLDETRTLVDEGIASLERGEGIDGETFVNQLLISVSSNLYSA